MKSLMFPDANVWLALIYEQHEHNQIAVKWYESLKESTSLIFCRFTQLGLFRLLSAESVMRQDTLSRQQCLNIYDVWIESGLAFFAQEPPGLDAALRTRILAGAISPKLWAEEYLAAFVDAGRLTLVTLDPALSAKVNDAVLLA